VNVSVRHPTILIIEDEEGVRSFFSKALELGGYQPVSATCAEDALRMMNQGLRPDAVLLDLAMPGMGGLGFLLQLGADPERRHIPVAIVTGHIAIPQPVQAAADALGVPVHHKPVDMDALLQLTNRLLTTRVHHPPQSSSIH
jgi:two-component system cell cycle response regulator